MVRGVRLESNWNPKIPGSNPVNGRLFTGVNGQVVGGHLADHQVWPDPRRVYGSQGPKCLQIGVLFR